uniref:Period circadian protein n=2 Tax=Lygus hesperus TaxID=30085 RepID=A0A0A9VU86_LYGHE
MLRNSNPHSTNMRSDAEETKNNKDVTDSGYSNSCCNSQSQRSGSSKCSGRAGSSGSGSSGFGVPSSPLEGPQKEGKDRKDKKIDQDKKSKRKKKTNADRNAATTTGAELADEDSKFSATSSPPKPSQPTAPQLMDTGVDTEVLQVAALSQTLHTMMKMKYQDTKQDDQDESAKDDTPATLKPLQPGENPTSKITSEQIASLKTDTLHEGELRIAVSILDGVVIYTSGLTQALGYPKDMWIGRSLIDFVHTKHRASFASFIIQSIAELIPGGSVVNGQRNVYFCCLRKYRGINKGYQLNDQRVNYLPCQITLQFRELPPVGDTFYKECLIITAVPVRSAYKYPLENRKSPKFMTRHSVNCQLVHVDPEVTFYFGFLPQDMLARSVLDFYHPEDLHFLKEVYEAVIKEERHPFRSKPYRFLCQNGGYVLIETELSSFINPWTRKLEFIIGQHKVLRGPDNPDVTTPCNDLKPKDISEEVLKESKIVKEEIKYLLNETVVRSPETAKQQVSKRCKDLAAFMENLMDEITKQPDLKIIVPTEEQSFSERDSVKLGEISPHHDYFDSKSMSETPPSYNQLNYNENIQRFFESKPITTVSDVSSSSGGDHSGSGEEGKTTPTNNSSSGSGSKSGDSGASSGQSTGSNGNSGETTSNDTSNNSNSEGFKAPALTEQLLSRHNEDMEKQMVQKHRVSGTKSERDSKVKERLKTAVKGQEMKNLSGDEPSGVITHGVKRSGSISWEAEPYKSLKASHAAPALQPANTPNTQQQPLLAESNLPLTSPTGSSAGPSTPRVIQPGPHIVPMTSASNVWSPFPVGSPSQVNGPPSQEFSGAAVNGALMPVYYHLQNQRSTETTTHPPSHHTPISYPQPAVQLMPSMLYHPYMYETPPIQMYSPIMYPPAGYILNNNRNNLPSTRLMPVAIKSEPIANIKARPTPSCDPHAPSIAVSQSQSTQKSSDNEIGSNEISTIPYDDSSYQSSFYSFLKTDKSDESMRSSSDEKPEVSQQNEI